MLTVVCFLWADPECHKLPDAMAYDAEAANVMKRMLDRHLTVPFEMVCATDIPEGLHPSIRTVELDRSLFVPAKRFPKLMIFRKDAEKIFGKRIFMVDLDTVVVANIDDIVSRPEPIVCWENPRKKISGVPFNSSFILLDAGIRPDIYAEFKPGIKDRDDQQILSRCLDGNTPTWTRSDGMHWVGEISDALPDDAKIVTFAGSKRGPRAPGAPEWLRAAYQ